MAQTCPMFLLEVAAPGTSALNAANITSLLITIAVVVGLAVRRNRRLHPAIMSGCFAGDITLVLWLELTRGAVETAVGSMSALMVTHIALATAMLVLYAVMTVSGFRLLKAGPARTDETLARMRRHRIGAFLFVGVRVLVLATALMVAGEVRGEDAPPPPGGSGPSEQPGPQTLPGRAIPQKGSGVVPP